MSQAGTVLPPGGGAGGVLKVDGDVGQAVPTVLGEMIVDGGTSVGGVATNINTIAGVNTVEVCLNNSISQPDTNAAGTTGMYSLGGNTFLHNYGANNTFLGELAGNLTLTTGGMHPCEGYVGLGANSLGLVGHSRYTVSIGCNAGANLDGGDSNILIGAFAGENLVFVDSNIALGTNALKGIAASTTARCISIGHGSLIDVTDGQDIIAIGTDAGSAYVGAEANNICIGDAGVVGESTTIRLGGLGTHTACYIQGIASVSVSNTEQVFIDTTTGQVGSQPIQAITNWQVIGASGPLAVNNGYVCTSGAALSFSLPATSAVGEMISLSLDGSTSWTITQGAGQSIRIGASATTPGVGGSLASAAQGDTVTMVCSIADTRWVVVSEIGTITVV